MKQGKKEEWVAALRSGNYVQTKGRLRDKTGYCCLGVMCDVFGNGKWEDDTEFVYVSIGKVWTCMPPEELTVHLDLNDGDVENLAIMNDSGATFSEIASYIEEYM